MLVVKFVSVQFIEPKELLYIKVLLVEPVWSSKMRWSFVVEVILLFSRTLPLDVDVIHIPVETLDPRTSILFPLMILVLEAEIHTPILSPTIVLDGPSMVILLFRMVLFAEL